MRLGLKVGLVILILMLLPSCSVMNKAAPNLQVPIPDTDDFERGLPKSDIDLGDRKFIAGGSKRSGPGLPHLGPRALGPGPRIQADRVMIVGDSLSVGIGSAMAELLENRPGVTVDECGKISTGLNSVRFYDWDAELREFLEDRNPDVLVVSIGGNDAHNGSGSQAWAEAFEPRVRSFLEIAVDHGVLVYWISLPPMQKDAFTERCRVANQVMRSVCEESEYCTYVDTWPLTSDVNQRFTISKYIDGRNVMLRTGDGAHFTFTGYLVVGQYILDQIAERVDIGVHAASASAAAN